jgi:hypothetical protein
MTEDNIGHEETKFKAYNEKKYQEIYNPKNFYCKKTSTHYQCTFRNHYFKHPEQFAARLISIMNVALNDDNHDYSTKQCIHKLKETELLSSNIHGYYTNFQAKKFYDFIIDNDYHKQFIQLGVIKVDEFSDLPLLNYYRNKTFGF